MKDINVKDLKGDFYMEYQKYQFCKSVNCKVLDEKCTIANCIYTAKHFHKWLIKNNFAIIQKNSSNQLDTGKLNENIR